MRRAVFLVALGITMPLAVYALDYSDQSKMYTDSPFTPAEAAGISVLTNVGAVQGNPDGTFLPGRTLNRAEFLKIVLESSPSIRVSPSDAGNCFPDVRTEDWFSKYVCLALKRGIVGGYPDGTFQPGSAVNYAEAVKMLVGIYGYWLIYSDNDQWFTPYMRAAEARDTLLPTTLQPDSLLKRGQMARLAARFLAQDAGELDVYKRAEIDLDSVAPVKEEEEVEEPTEEKATETGSTVPTGTGAEVPVQTGATVPAVTYPFPTKSRQMMLGEKYLVADGTFFSPEEIGYVRVVNLEFDKEVKSFEKLWLVDGNSAVIGEITRDIYDDTKKKWKGTFSANKYYIAARKENVLGIVAQLKEKNKGGIPDELFRLRKFFVTVRGATTDADQQLAANIAHFPLQQTVQAKIISVTSTLVGTGSLRQNPNQILGEFEITSDALQSVTAFIKNLRFTIKASAGVTVTNWHLMTDDDPVTRHPCSVGSDGFINCNALPSDMSVVNPVRRYRLMGDVALSGGGAYSLQVLLEDPGSTNTAGAVWWSDGTTTYPWIDYDGTLPMAAGTVWR